MKTITMVLVKTGQTKVLRDLEDDDRKIFAYLDAFAKELGLKPFVVGKSRVSAYYGRFWVEEKQQ